MELSSLVGKSKTVKEASTKTLEKGEATKATASANGTTNLHIDATTTDAAPTATAEATTTPTETKAPAPKAATEAQPAKTTPPDRQGINLNTTDEKAVSDEAPKTTAPLVDFFSLGAFMVG